MSFSSYDPHTRYRRRSIDRLKNFVVVSVLLGAVFALGFWIGGMASAQHVRLLQEQVERSEAREVELEQVVTEIQAGAQTAMLKFEQLQEEVAETIPEGPMEELVVLLKKQLDSGVDPKRLNFVIRSSRPPQNCTEAQNRRFVILTPAYKGPESAVEIAKGISVKGSGSSAHNDKGEPEAWYDPTKRVTIEFVKSDGTIEKKTGVLPLHNSLVVDGREYRFSIEEGAKSFARVTFDSCDYP